MTTKPPKSNVKCSIYKAKDGWRWRMKRGGKIIAESGEAYSRPRSLRITLHGLIRSIFAGKIEFVSDVASTAHF